MAPKITHKKSMEVRGRNEMQSYWTALLLACGLAILSLCYMYMDNQSFYQKSATEPVVLQNGSGVGSVASRGSEEQTKLRTSPSREVSSELVIGENVKKEELVDEKTEDPESDEDVAVSGLRTKTLQSTDISKDVENVEDLHNYEDNLTTFKHREEEESAFGEDDKDATSSPLKKDTSTTTFRDSIMSQSEKGAIVLPSTSTEERRASLAECDISQGRWVYDNVSHPLYRTKNCPFADPGFRCEENGRPDTDFMKYRWQPHHCDLPRFNATDMLERLRNQRVVFVGDSLGRNDWESMLCMLAEGVSNKSRIYEVNGESISKHSGRLIFKFEDYNCTVEYYRDPFLVPQTRPPRGAPHNVTCALRIDKPSWSSASWGHADILIFNAGHWWTAHKIFEQGCMFQEGNKIKNYSLESGFKRAMRSWGTWMENDLDAKRTQVFFVSFATVHFRGGAWNRGGHCHQEKRPLTEEEARAEWQVPWTNAFIKNEIENNIQKNRGNINYIDITTATNYRSDGHGALYNWDTHKYGLKPRNRQDCSHFCLPGVPDTWNELIFGTLLARGQGTWGRPIKVHRHL